MKMITFTEHALFQMQRRGISEKNVRAIIENPGQTEKIRPGRIVMQSRIVAGKSRKKSLVRVFVDEFDKGVKVVTVYRTSKVEKYWR